MAMAMRTKEGDRDEGGDRSRNVILGVGVVEHGNDKDISTATAMGTK